MTPSPVGSGSSLDLSRRTLALGRRPPRAVLDRERLYIGWRSLANRPLEPSVYNQHLLTKGVPANVTWNGDKQSPPGSAVLRTYEQSNTGTDCCTGTESSTVSVPSLSACVPLGCCFCCSLNTHGGSWHLLLTSMSCHSRFCSLALSLTTFETLITVIVSGRPSPLNWQTTCALQAPLASPPPFHRFSPEKPSASDTLHGLLIRIDLR